MAKIELILPKMGESVAEATVTAWLKEEGDKVELEEGILEIATDKVDSEVPSTHDGVLIQKLCKEGDVVKIGAPVAIIEIEGDAVVEKEDDFSSSAYDEVPAEPVEKSPAQTPKVSSASELPKNAETNRFYSPLVRNIAKQEGIGIEELEAVPGTGREGRVTKEDLLSYVANRGTSPAKGKTVTTPNVAPSISSSPAISVSGASEIVEMDRMRKLIAEHMVKSKQTSPHVSSFIEIDVTNLVNWRNKVKNEFQNREGYKITFTPIFVEAVAKAIKDFPMINVSVDGDKIIVKKDVNIGMAVALPSGNLIVPVVKGADQRNIIGLSKSVNDLSGRARENKLTPDDIQDGTFTITNIGTFGNAMGTPIINQPQVAILATGVIQKKPAVIETPQGDTIGIRHMMFLSMSYDHRVVDGILGGSFLRKVGDYLENFDINRQIW